MKNLSWVLALSLFLAACGQADSGTTETATGPVSEPMVGDTTAGGGTWGSILKMTACPGKILPGFMIGGAPI